MTYPLGAGGIGDYPVRVGSMLLTMVDPTPGYEQAYNRWYERDHYYAGCLVGPWLFAGSRWVATRTLKDLRWPHGDVVAKPWDAGSYLAMYWVEQGHHDEHFGDWARPQVNRLYAQGRGFPERRHIHTVLFDHLGAVYRDRDPVPVDLALDAGYDAIVAAWFDGAEGTPAAALADRLAGPAARAIAGTGIEIVSSWTPSAGENEPKNVPMDLGTRAGGPERLLQVFFVRGDVREVLGALHAYVGEAEAGEGATGLLVAPFVRTVVGTDTYVDELW